MSRFNDWTPDTVRVIPPEDQTPEERKRGEELIREHEEREKAREHWNRLHPEDQR
jgi:hypothetical protein